MPRSPSKSALIVALAFGGAVLLFTALGILLSPPDAQVGGTRTAGSIPLHLGELAAFGLLLGMAGAVFYGRRGVPLVFLTPTLTVLLDLDHLPVYLGFSQPIRPAHSLVFLAVVLAITAITIKAPEFELVVMSAFLGHMSVDTGLFPPFSPFTFDYYQIDPYGLPFALIAVLAAVGAGVIVRSRKTSPGVLA